MMSLMNIMVWKNPQEMEKYSINSGQVRKAVHPTSYFEMGGTAFKYFISCLYSPYVSDSKQDICL